MTGLLAVNIAQLLRTFSAAGYRLTAPIAHGPTGWIWRCESNPSHLGSVIVSQAEHDDGVAWIHASIAFRTDTPTYTELALLHRAVFGRRRWAYQVFAPEDDHVNIHEHALHLWGRADGQPCMPNFGAFGSV